MLAVVAKIAVDIGADPTAHNLWPFEVLDALAVAGAGIVCIQLLRRFAPRWACRTERS